MAVRAVEDVSAPLRNWSAVKSPAYGPGGCGTHLR